MNEFEQSLGNYFETQTLTYIQKIKIGIAGAGGLGSNIANCLVRSGFKNFEILDLDIIETKNLNRQNYFLSEIGHSKVETLKKRLLQINPDCQIITHQIKLTTQNTKEYFQNTAILFEAFDEVASKKLILEEYGNADKLIISGCGMAGYNNQPEIKIRKVSKKIYIVGDEQTEVSKSTPPLAPRVITCASLMASIALEKASKLEL
ncbi:sulfur carrier protein ThiS adenylyltransferase ThiF [bacterium]|nr:sulfur carrier protein ThiS adenylyltransferase ThiF [bacterium]